MQPECQHPAVSRRLVNTDCRRQSIIAAASSRQCGVGTQRRCPWNAHPSAAATARSTCARGRNRVVVVTTRSIRSNAIRPLRAYERVGESIRNTRAASETTGTCPPNSRQQRCAVGPHPRACTDRSSIAHVLGHPSPSGHRPSPPPRAPPPRDCPPTRPSTCRTWTISTARTPITRFPSRDTAQPRNSYRESAPGIGTPTTPKTAEVEMPWQHEAIGRHSNWLAKEFARSFRAAMRVDLCELPTNPGTGNCSRPPSRLESSPRRHWPGIATRRCSCADPGMCRHPRWPCETPVRRCSTCWRRNPLPRFGRCSAIGWSGTSTPTPTATGEWRGSS